MPAKYDAKQRRDAFLEYALTGSTAQVCRKFNINKTTLIRWRKSEWWIEFEEELKREQGASPSAQVLAEQLDEIARRMVRRLERPGVIDALDPKDLAVTLERVIRTRELERGDENSMRKRLESMDDDEIDSMIAQLQKDIEEQETKFGESSYKPEDNHGKTQSSPKGSTESAVPSPGSEAQ